MGASPEALRMVPRGGLEPPTVHLFLNESHYLQGRDPVWGWWLCSGNCQAYARGFFNPRKQAPKPSTLTHVIYATLFLFWGVSFRTSSLSPSRLCRWSAAGRGGCRRRRGVITRVDLGGAVGGIYTHTHTHTHTRLRPLSRKLRGLTGILTTVLCLASACDSVLLDCDAPSSKPFSHSPGCLAEKPSPATKPVNKGDGRATVATLSSRRDLYIVMG